MKLFLLIISTCILLNCRSQNTFPKLEMYAAPGLFFEQLNNDSLIPPKRHNSSRLGDVVSYSMQSVWTLKNQRWIFKGGIGFSQRHYSLNKYSIGDFFTALFLFDSPPRYDSFNISYVRFTNNYFELPVSFARILTKPGHNFQSTVGINVRSSLLLKSSADITFDNTYTPTQPDSMVVKKAYTQNASKFVLIAEPYIDGSFKIYKNAGGYFQFRPFSFYASRLNTEFTSSTVEFFSFAFGLYYSFR
jgi:hypothetical protein